MTQTVFTRPKTIFTDQAVAKAMALVDAGSIELADTPDTFYVPSTTSGVHYRVTIDYDGPRATWASCTCQHGRHRTRPGQTLCYHAVAALLHVIRVRDGGMGDLLAVEEA